MIYQPFTIPRPASNGQPSTMPGKVSMTAVLLGLLAMLGGCGGGGGDAGTPAANAPTVTGTPASNAPTVTGMTVDRLSYGRLSTFTVTGSNLSSSVTYAATGCDGVTVLAGGTAAQQQVTCTPNKALNVRIAASASGSELQALNQAVPKPRVTLATSLGELVIELEPAIVQATVDNFLTYVNAGFYNGTIFHRVIPGFVVQGGGFTGATSTTLTAQTGMRATIALESNKGLSNVRGTIAMARTNAADSATSQFFINTVNNATMLDFRNATNPGYAVFGSVVSGLTVVDAISAVTTRTVGNFADVPSTNVVVQTAVQSL